MSILDRSRLLILGHRNPDTDASTSAFALSDFINRTGLFGGNSLPGVAGPLPPQARYVFERAKVVPPTLISHLRPRIADVATRDVRCLRPHQTLGDGFEALISSGRSMIPIVDDDGRVTGIFSHRRDIFKYLLGFSVAPLLGQLLTWSDLGEMPGATDLSEEKTDAKISGELRIALQGDRSWEESCSTDDVLVCSGLKAWNSLPTQRKPRRVIVIGPVGGETARPPSLIQYEGELATFLQDLQTQIRLSALDFGLGPCVGCLDEIQDVSDLVISSRHALPVLDESGRLYGVVAKSDLKKAESQRVVLVDHFEASQAVPGIEYADIVGLVDHHRVGDLQTKRPIPVDCRTVGSSCTIVAARYREKNLEPTVSIAILLLGGLISDTLALKGPTTTDFDVDIAAFLGRISGLDFPTFSMEVLSAGDDLQTAEPSKIWERDRKEFSILNRTISIAQLETVALASISEQKLRQFRELLKAHHVASGEFCSVLFITDVLEQTSWATFYEAEEARGIVEETFGKVWVKDDYLLLDGLVSRKKQVLPRLLDRVATRAAPSHHKK